MKKRDTTKEKFRFWCGWVVPVGLPKSDMKKKWPAGMWGWISGHGEDYVIWCAIVIAKTAQQAEATVRSCYGKYADQIEMRWEPEPNPLTWTPGDRFPMPRGVDLS